MSQEEGTLSEMMKMLVQFESRIQSQLQNVLEALQELKKTKDEVTTMKTEMEAMWKRALSKTVVIPGIPDVPEETMEQTELKVRDIVHKLGVQHLDVDIARRMGRFEDGKIRPVELTLVRQKQKIQIMTAKSKLKENEGTRRIYISEARTPAENRKFFKLLDHARKLKDKDINTKFRITGGQVLEVQSREVTGKFHVDDQWEVKAWNQKEEASKTTGDGEKTRKSK